MTWIIIYLLITIIVLQVILTMVYMAYRRAARSSNKHWMMVLKNQMAVQQDLQNALKKIDYVTTNNKLDSSKK